MKRHRLDADEDDDVSDYKYVRQKVDIADLLFTPERDYLVKNNGQKVKVDEVKGKAIVLLIFPLDLKYLRESVTFHMIEAYQELKPLGGVEFIFVPVQLKTVEFAFLPGAIFNHLFSALPFPAVPFSDLEACGARVLETFQLLRGPRREMPRTLFPQWVIIDPNNEVVMWRTRVPIFKLFGGAELHPLSNERIQTLLDEHQGSGIDRHRCEARKRLIGQWEQLLASPTRDFLLSSNGDKVPISSLKGKVIGLYFCENVRRPPHMKMIDKVYRDAKLHGYDLEIVQINFHFKSCFCYETKHVSTEDMSIQKCNKKTSWLTLPFKDPSCRKLQRILACNYQDDLEFIDDIEEWGGDHLVIVDPRQTDDSGPRFEFSGIEIFRRYGVEGYPFTRQSLYELEHKIQEREGWKRLRLESLFPPGECRLIRPSPWGQESDLVDGSELSGKRVLVLLADESMYNHNGEFVTMLQSKYRAQDNVVDEIRFEVVYVSRDSFESNKSVKDMPWLVHPFDKDFFEYCIAEAFGSSFWGIGVVAFGEDGEVVAKRSAAPPGTWEGEEAHEQEFPFFSDDTAGVIRRSVIEMCDLNEYYYLPEDES